MAMTRPVSLQEREVARDTCNGPGQVRHLVRRACSHFTGRVYSKSYECLVSSILIVILPNRPVN